MNSHVPTPGTRISASRHFRLVVISAFALCLAALFATSAAATNTVSNSNSTSWQVHDGAMPGLDTGSIRTSTNNALQGYGGLRMVVGESTVENNHAMNGELLRGFGFTWDKLLNFQTTQAVNIDGVSVTRKLKFDVDPAASTGSWARYYDTFTNTTSKELTIEVAFGGQLGYNTGTNQSAIKTTSSGDTTIGDDDSWTLNWSPRTVVEPATPSSANGPSATLYGDYPDEGFRTGNFLLDPFNKPLASSGDHANHYGYVYTLTIPARQTKALAHFIVVGRGESASAVSGDLVAGVQVQRVQDTITELATTPDFSGLTDGEICAIQNFTVPVSITCPLPSAGNPISTDVLNFVPAETPKTVSPYDVVGKTWEEMSADLKSGATTVQKIVRAYLDRIAAYDRGQFSLKSVLTVAPDAMQQAKAADQARADGDTRPLLGLPVLAKDLYDTKDMPTTGGAYLFDGYIPEEDAWQIAKLREAGAIILGKANLAKYATDGHFSPSDYGQVWNSFLPSVSSIGSSGGSASALAASFAAVTLGSQTGDSLWGPASGHSIYSLRGTDGMQSADRVMPLTAIQDYAGSFARSVKDLAMVLEATAIGNPTDPLDDVSDGHRPAEWQSYLTDDALEGVTIGVQTASMVDPFGTTGTTDAMRDAFQYFRDAGAKVVETATPMVSAPPNCNSLGWNGGVTGWNMWIDQHAADLASKGYPSTHLEIRGNATPASSQEAIDCFENYRATYRSNIEDWMENTATWFNTADPGETGTGGIDVVLYGGLLSDIHLNDSIQPSFGRIDPQSSASGLPTMIFPAGENDNGQPINLQLQGKTYSDPELLGYAYAFEKHANGKRETSFFPALDYDPDAFPQEIPKIEPAPVPPTPYLPIPEGDSKTVTNLTGKTVKALGKTKSKFSYLVGCASSTGSCTGTAKVKIGGKTLKTVKFTVKAGKSKTLTFKLPAAVSKKLRAKKKVKGTITITGTGGAGGPGPLTLILK